MELNGQNESYALLPISANPPPIKAFAGLGPHALTFAGEVGLLSTLDEVADLQAALDDTDDPFSWDLDIIVGPEWRSVKTTAPLVAVTDVHSSNADSDDNFQFAVSFRSSKWSVQNLGGQEDRMQRRGFFCEKAPHATLGQWHAFGKCHRTAQIYNQTTCELIEVRRASP